MIDPINYDLTVERGASMGITFQINSDTDTPFDFTGWTIMCQVRRTQDSPDTVISLTEGSGITVTDLTGTIRLDFTRTQTDIEPGRYYYDIYATNTSNAGYYPVEGQFIINPRVSKP